MDITVEQVLNLGTHGALLLVILWQRVDMSRKDDRLDALQSRLIDLLDKADRVIAQLDNRD